MPSPKQLALTLALHAALFVVYGLAFLTLLYCLIG
jgi:hypothetical protein